MQNSVVSRSVAKRTTDILVAAFVLIAASPVLLAAIVAIVVTMGRPAFFIQERTGWRGQQFRLLKLRTMKSARDRNGDLLPDAQRLTSLGKFLRKSSIDELPELINVIRGDMSLVGPRPLLPRYDPWYLQHERVRFAARPGITGLAQVNGRNNLGWDARLNLDAHYVHNWSYLADLVILAKTGWHSVAGSGVAVVPNAVMQDLDMERQCRVSTMASR